MALPDGRIYSDSSLIINLFSSRQDLFPAPIHNVYIINPGNFWQKQKTSLGTHKYKFETCLIGLEELMKKVRESCSLLLGGIRCDHC